MTNEERKDIATKLDFALMRKNTSVAELEAAIERVRNIIDELDPPKPEPGTPIQWRSFDSDGEYLHGVVSANGEGIYGQFGFMRWGLIEWKLATIPGHRLYVIKKHECECMQEALETVISKASLVADATGKYTGEVCFVDSFDFIRNVLKGDSDD